MINKVDLECSDATGWFPIHLICRFGTFEMIKYIIDKGVNLERKINFNDSPIHIICKHGTFESLKYIVDKGVSLNVVNNSSQTPAHVVCEFGTLEMIKYIFDKDIVYEEDHNGNLPRDLIIKNEKIKQDMIGTYWIHRVM